MKIFTKTIPARHPLVSELIDTHGAESYAYLTMLLELAQEIGPFELTPAILARECRIKNPRLSRIFPDMKVVFEKAQVSLGILKKPEETSSKSNKVDLSSTSEGQNPDGSTRDLREEEIREEKKTSSQRMLRSTDEQMAIAVWMSEKIRDLNPSSKEPNFSAWANEIRLMVESDKRSLAEIKELFTWVQSDSFWRTNVLSPGKLREKWDQLQIKRRNPVKIANFPQKSTAVDGRNIVAGADREYISGSFKDVLNAIDSRKDVSSGSA